MMKIFLTLNIMFNKLTYHNIY